MKIPISEIFESIQWEWKNTWKPSIFIRFWWCNLACIWCDSKYSWDSKIEKPKEIKLEKIIDKVKSFHSKHLVFTWWEPLLHQKHIKLIQKNLPWYTFELETNWTIKLDEELVFEQINISPKLKNSWSKKHKLNVLNSDFKYDMKFVCSNSIDLKEVQKFLKNTNLKNLKDIYIMPLWTDKKSQINEKIIDFCIKNWYNYCLRQHIILFWNKKWF